MHNHRDAITNPPAPIQSRRPSAVVDDYMLEPRPYTPVPYTASMNGHRIPNSHNASPEPDCVIRVLDSFVIAH